MVGRCHLHFWLVIRVLWRQKNPLTVYKLSTKPNNFVLSASIRCWNRIVVLILMPLRILLFDELFNVAFEWCACDLVLLLLHLIYTQVSKRISFLALLYFWEDPSPLFC